MLSQLAPSEKVESLFNFLNGLIWRDAEERAMARDLVFETTLPGIDNHAFELRYQAAEAAWEVWEQTDRELTATLRNFLSNLSNSCF